MVGEIVALIAELIERGHAYAVEGDVYFRVRSLPEYGALSHRDVDQMDQGEGVEGAALKEDPLDFALWKARKPMEDTAWDAPWGEGRPGWHIECSAMAEATLGAPFEIHGGGNDLIFPHHENEAAQTLAARGHELAQIWMHNGMLEMGGERCRSRSATSAGSPRCSTRSGRDTLLMFFCEGHYRQPLAFTREKLDDAARRVERIRNAGRRLVAGRLARGAGAAPRRVLRRAGRRLQHAARARGAGGVDPRGQPRRRAGRRRPPARDARRARAREPARRATRARRPRSSSWPSSADAARAARDFAEADRLRDELRARGWEVRDGPEGPSSCRSARDGADRGP